ncbi:MAG TPA: RNA-binding protein [Candidatus Hydrogenedentes bacterium]|mgnify:CR=1 FL=1|nr:RNA-binding protein [Candidatus Hydrogenedentota bacterium]
MNVYVGNLPYTTSSDDLRVAFEAFGEVTSANVISDRDSGRSKGFGFVEMSDDAQAKEAIEKLNGTEMDGRTITVNEARPREDRPRGGGRRGGGGYGGGRGRY